MHEGNGSSGSVLLGVSAGVQMRNSNAGQRMDELSLRRRCVRERAVVTVQESRVSL